MFPGFIYSIDTDPAQHIRTTETGSNADDLDDLYGLDHDR